MNAMSCDDERMRSQVSTLACVILLSTLVVSGCAALDGTPPPETRSPLARRPDGERGHGWFVTAWGLEEIDYVWRGGQRVYDGDLALDETEREVPTPPPGQSVQALLSVEANGVAPEAAWTAAKAQVAQQAG